MRRLLRSFALRTALAVAGAALLLSLLGSGWGWWQADQALRQQLDLVLANEAEGLVRDYQTMGTDALLDAAAISARRGALLIVFVQTADGEVLGGRLPGAPVALRGFATLHPPGEAPLRALGALLPGGINLVVAVHAAAVEDAARALAWTPFLASLGAGGLALMFGFMAARALERRLALISDTAGLVAAGDLTRRLPESGRDDEFDRLVATVNRMLVRLEGLMVAQRQVTDDIAHDLRSPLQRLRQNLEEALGKAGDPAAAEALSTATADLDRVLETFAGLLRIARAEAGAGERHPLDLSALVNAVAEAFAPAAEEVGRGFAIDVMPGLRIIGDPALLQRMLANLLDNALTHGAGTIRVALSAGPVLEVSDDGPGIEPAAREAVLRRFVRLDRSRTTAGTGLGLALVAAAVQAHRGTLALTSARPDGGGLNVRIELSAAAL